MVRPDGGESPQATSGTPARRFNRAAILCVISSLGYLGWIINYVAGSMGPDDGMVHPTAAGTTMFAIIYCLVGCIGFAIGAQKLRKAVPDRGTARQFATFDLSAQVVFFVFKSGSPILMVLSAGWIVVDIAILVLTVKKVEAM